MGKDIGCDVCNSKKLLLSTEPEIMGNGAKRNLRVYVDSNCILNIERITMRKRSFDVEYFGRCKVDFCPSCGRLLGKE
jgi:hypothetical protein